MNYKIRKEDGSTLQVDEFNNTTFDSRSVNLTVVEGDNFVTITIPGRMFKAAEVFKVEKFLGFKIFHEVEVLTWLELGKKLSKSQIHS